MLTSGKIVLYYRCMLRKRNRKEEIEMRVTSNDMAVLEAITEMVEEKEMIKKAEKAILNSRVKELVAQGIDRELAKVMAKCGL